MCQERFETERRRAFLITVRGIASHLGGWSFVEPDEDWGGRLLTLEGPRGQSLELVWVPGDKGRVEGVIPKCPNKAPTHVRSQEGKLLTIGVSFTRPPDKLARDIERRLLPGYGQVFERIKGEIEQVEARDKQARGILGDLTSACRCLPQTDRQRLRHEVTLADELGTVEIASPADGRPPFVYLRLALPDTVAGRVLGLVAELQRCTDPH